MRTASEMLSNTMATEGTTISRRKPDSVPAQTWQVLQIEAEYGAATTIILPPSLRRADSAEAVTTIGFEEIEDMVTSLHLRTKKSRQHALELICKPSKTTQQDT